jgi:hypothetical protein
MAMGMHYDDVRKGATSPQNTKTMGGAERLSEGDLSHSDSGARSQVNSNGGDLMRAHANMMEAHRDAMCGMKQSSAVDRTNPNLKYGSGGSDEL